MNQSLWIYQVQSRIWSFSTKTYAAITTHARWLLREHGILHVRCCIRIGTVAIAHSFSSLLFSSLVFSTHFVGGQSACSAACIRLISLGLSVNEQYFSLTPNQPTVFLVMAYKPNKLTRTGRLTLPLTCVGLWWDMIRSHQASNSKLPVRLTPIFSLFGFFF